MDFISHQIQNVVTFTLYLIYQVAANEQYSYVVLSSVEHVTEIQVWKLVHQCTIQQLTGQTSMSFSQIDKSYQNIWLPTSELSDHSDMTQVSVSLEKIKLRLT